MPGIWFKGYDLKGLDAEDYTNKDYS